MLLERRIWVRKHLLNTKNPKWVFLPKTTRLIPKNNFSIGSHGGWGGCISNRMRIIGNVHSYKGTNLGNDMLCDSVNSDQKEKKILIGNFIINLNNFITNIYNL